MAKGQLICRFPDTLNWKMCGESIQKAKICRNSSFSATNVAPGSQKGFEEHAFLLRGC